MGTHYTLLSTLECLTISLPYQPAPAFTLELALTSPSAPSPWLNLLPAISRPAPCASQQVGRAIRPQEGGEEKAQCRRGEACEHSHINTLLPTTKVFRPHLIPSADLAFGCLVITLKLSKWCSSQSESPYFLYFA